MVQAEAAAAPWTSLGEETFEGTGAEAAGDGGVIIPGRQARPAEQERQRQLHRRLERAAQGRPRPDKDAGGEVLRFPLAVDGRVGHHRHLLLEVVGEILPGEGKGRQGSVVAEGGDGILTAARHLPQILQVRRFPGEGGEEIFGEEAGASDQGPPSPSPPPLKDRGLSGGIS